MSTKSEESLSPVLKQTETASEMNPYEMILINRIIQARRTAIEKIKKCFQGIIV